MATGDQAQYLQLDLSGGLYQAVRKIAGETGMTVEQYVNRLIRDDTHRVAKERKGAAREVSDLAWCLSGSPAHLANYEIARRVAQFDTAGRAGVMCGDGDCEFAGVPHLHPHRKPQLEERR